MLNRRRMVTNALAASALSLAVPQIARGATRTMRLAHNNTATSPVQVFAEAFSRSANELSGGTLAFDIFPSAQLGNDEQLIRNTAESSVDAVVSGTSVLNTLFGDFGFAEIPYMFRDARSAQAAFDGPLGEHLKGGLRNSGFRVLGWGESGFRHISARRAIRRPADLADMKIRVQPAKLQVEAFRLLGARPEAIAFSELGEALKVGRVDGQENPTGIIVSNTFIYTQQTHVSLTGHVYSPFILGMSNEVLADLTADQRQVIERAGRIGAAASRELAAKGEQSNIERLRSLGLTVVSDVDTAAFQRAMADGRDRLAASVGADVFNRVRSLVS